MLPAKHRAGRVARAVRSGPYRILIATDITAPGLELRSVPRQTPRGHHVRVSSEINFREVHLAPRRHFSAGGAYATPAPRQRAGRHD